MANIEQILEAIHTYTGRPDAQKFLSTARRKLLGRIDYYFNLLGLANNTNRLVRSCQFEVQAGIEIYNITAQTGDFGKEIVVETYDDTNPNFYRRDIDIVAIQDIDRVYSGRQQAQAIGGTFAKHSAVAMSFYGLPEVQIRVTPIPSESATYRIWYEPLKGPNEPLLAEMPITPPNFDDLLAVHTALLSLTDAEWAEFAHLDVEKRFGLNAQKREEKRQELQPEFDRLWAVFNDWRLVGRHEQDISRSPYNSYRRGGRGNGRTRWGW